MLTGLADFKFDMPILRDSPEILAEIFEKGVRPWSRDTKCFSLQHD